MFCPLLPLNVAVSPPIRPSPTILGLTGQNGMNGVVYFFFQTMARKPLTNSWSCTGADIISLPHLSLCIPAPPASLPLASRSVSLCYLKPEILPLAEEPLCCICLPRCLCVSGYACVRACVSVYESALKKKKKTQAASGRARERGERDTRGGKGKKHLRRQQERECETAMKFIQAICLLLLCPALSLNTR